MLASETLRALERFLRTRKGWTLALALAGVVAVGFVDYSLGPELASSIFYLLPIALAAWYLGRRVALIIAIFSALTWIVADVLSGVSFSHPLVAVWNTGVRLSFFTIVLLLLVEVRSKLELAEHLALTDSLTGAANSRRFYLLAEQALAQASRRGDAVTLAYIDLDNFKEINDAHGHQAGDDLLKLIAQLLEANVRRADTVARLGGDEFALLMPDTELDDAKVVIERLRARLLEAMHDRRYPVTFSIGVSVFPTPPATVDETIRAADRLMYTVKRSGKNHVQYEQVG